MKFFRFTTLAYAQSLRKIKKGWRNWAPYTQRLQNILRFVLKASKIRENIIEL